MNWSQDQFYNSPAASPSAVFFIPVKKLPCKRQGDNKIGLWTLQKSTSLIFDRAPQKHSMCLVIVRFLGLALPWGPALRLPDAHRLCPLADSLVGAVNSVGAGQNALCHLLNVSSLISGLSHLPFSVAGIFFLFLICLFSHSVVVNSL